MSDSKLYLFAAKATHDKTEIPVVVITDQYSTALIECAEKVSRWGPQRTTNIRFVKDIELPDELRKDLLRLAYTVEQDFKAIQGEV